MGSRPRDLAYVLFFLFLSIPATIIFDLQLAIPPAWTFILGPVNLKHILDRYMGLTNDPVVGSVAGYFGEEVQRQFIWVKWFMWVEMCVYPYLFPIFISIQSLAMYTNVQ